MPESSGVESGKGVANTAAEVQSDAASKRSERVAPARARKATGRAAVAEVINDPAEAPEQEAPDEPSPEDLAEEEALEPIDPNEAEDILIAEAQADRVGADVDLVRAYLKEIGKTKLLTAEQEVDLSKGIEVGLYAAEIVARSMWFNGEQFGPFDEKDLQLLIAQGERDKNHLLRANLRLVVSIAKRYTGRGVEFLDLIQHGNLGLVRAVEKFDYTKGYKFSNYATWRIRQPIIRAIADEARTVRLPEWVVVEIYHMSDKERDLAMTLGREPEPEEVAEAMGLPVERVIELHLLKRRPFNLDEPLTDDGALSLGDTIDSPAALAAFEGVDQGRLNDLLYEVLATLDLREQRIIEERFGLKDGRPKNRNEIGRRLGLTRERIRQIENLVMCKLSHPSRSWRLLVED